ncbi:hypothetical protein [Bacillus nitratireducens]|uniref:hypothetical protein n=1 Tax=Bacillus nitratireducens TaxID=2026193 RepID=UPI000BF297D1|nr:hypothetical protein COI95_07345 [Bacillus cereus]
MIPMLKYKDTPNQTLEVKFILGSMYFILMDDEYGSFVHCVFLGNRAREFMRILSNGELAEVFDRGGDLLRIRPLKDGYFGIEIESKGMARGFLLDKQQVQELSDWFQRVHKL